MLYKYTVFHEVFLLRSKGKKLPRDGLVSLRGRLAETQQDSNGASSKRVTCLKVRMTRMQCVLQSHYSQPQLGPAIWKLSASYLDRQWA